MLGLVIGKFMPLTKGHISLINFALKNCDELIVAVCTQTGEVIDGDIRYQWVKKEFENNKKIRIEWLVTDLPNSSVSNRGISKVWAGYLKKKFPSAEIFFASEKYGEYVAEYMNIKYKLYDVDRKIVPISATMIRNNPFKYWDFIPEIVKPYFNKKICIYGSDSCGKSTLTMDLAKYYKTTYVPELARNIIEWGNLDCDNLKTIHLDQFAKMQYEAIKSMNNIANKLLICDSDNITTQIYSNVYCGEVTDETRRYEISYDLYLFLDIDTNYIEEGQRNLKDRRFEMKQRFIDELNKRNTPFTLINGSWDERFDKSIIAIDKLLNK